MTRLKPVELEHLLPKDIDRETAMRHVSLAEKLPIPARLGLSGGHGEFEAWTVREHEVWRPLLPAHIH